MRQAFLVLAIIAGLGVGAGLGAEWTWPPDENVADLVEAGLSRHFESDSLRAYLKSADSEHRQALEFLLAWLPTSDLGALSAAALIENVDLALTAWHEAQWRDEIDPYTFHTYVLPHRVSQEPVQPWRARLRELVAPRVAGLDLGDAALEVNRFCREWATYKASSPRDQGPLTTMERGLGRCEEEMILTISALRSVGIPARNCAAPWWTVTDGNHAWTEVYAGREAGWRYMGSCEPAACLDHAWFSRAARRTGIVLSTGYGELPVPAAHRPSLHSQRRGVSVLNSIEVYGDPGALSLAAPDRASWDEEAGEDPPEAYVHVFNMGALSALAGRALGEEILLGPGDYVVTAEIDSQPWSALARIRAGETTVLELVEGLAILDGPTWLRYPPASDEQDTDCPIDEDDPVWLRHQRDTARMDLERCARSRLTHEALELLSRRDDASDLLERLESAGPGRAELVAAVHALPRGERAGAVDLIAQMDIKDVYECDLGELPEILKEIARVRGLSGTDVPDSLWNAYVLSPRLYFQPGTMRWWKDLPWIGSSPVDPPDAQEILAAFRERVSEAETSHLGHVAAPEETWRSGFASGAGARACLVGLFRRNGIPARAQRGTDYVEAWRDGDWVRSTPFEAQAPGESDDGAEAGDERGRLSVRYYDQERQIADIETWRQTRLTRFADGRFTPWFVGQLSEGDGLVEWSLPVGEYWLFGGLRNPRGEPRFVARRVVVSAGDSLSFDLDIGVPLTEWDPADLVQREWDPASSLDAMLEGGDENRDVPDAGNRLLVLTLSGHESSIRHLEAIESVDWEALGVTLIPIQVGGLADHPPDPGVLWLGAEAAERAFGIGNPNSDTPLTILIDDSDETVIWLRGMRSDLAGFVREMLSGDL